MSSEHDKERRKKAKDSKNNTLIFSQNEEVQSEEASKALLREFMHSKKLMKTLQAFDKEQPRGDITIQSRSVMANLLELHSQQSRNKERNTPFKTLLEVICDDRLRRRGEGVDSDSEEVWKGRLEGEEESFIGLEKELEGIKREIEEMEGIIKKAAKKAEKSEKNEKNDNNEKSDKNEAKSEVKKNAKKAEKKEKNEKKKKKQKKAVLSIDQLLEVGEKHTQLKKHPSSTSTTDTPTDWADITRNRAKEEEEKYVLTERQAYYDELKRVAGLKPSPGKDSLSAPAGSTASLTASQPLTTTESDEEDLDDYTRSLREIQKQTNGVSTKPTSMQDWSVDPTAIEVEQDKQPEVNKDILSAPSEGLSIMPTVKGRPIGIQGASKLHKLICGKIRIPDSWCQQGFHFSSYLPYGIVQNTGGPCGLLAVIQARIIKYLYFNKSGEITEDDQKTALIESLTETLQVIASGGSVALALPPDLPQLRPVTTVDFEDWRITTLGRDTSAVRNAILENYDFFHSPRGLGMLSLLVSAVYTRGGPDAVLSDMDSAGTEGSLVVCHQYSSQELVSLLIFGRAHSNVFDGDKNLSGMILRGVPFASDMGLLTYQEYTRDIEVGSYFKNPKYPIWLIWNESHYCVAFSKIPLDNNQSVADIFYYDQLGRQDEEYRLTVDATKTAPERVSDLTPFMDDILRTRDPWNGAHVDWNGSEGLL